MEIQLMKQEYIKGDELVEKGGILLSSMMLDANFGANNVVG